MSAQRMTARERAYLIWRRSGGSKKLSDIARQLDVSSSTVRAWKRKDDWEAKASGKSVAGRKPGAQPGNRNACGAHNVNQDGNQRAVRHGAYARLMAERMTEDERAAWAETEYCADPLEAVRLEVSQINVQQLRLMTRMQELREHTELLEKQWDSIADGQMCDISDLGADAQSAGTPAKVVARIGELIASCNAERDTLEAALDRASGRKTKLLGLLIAAGREQTAPVAVEFAFGAPGVPVHEEGGSNDD